MEERISSVLDYMSESFGIFIWVLLYCLCLVVTLLFLSWVGNKIRGKVAKFYDIMLLPLGLGSAAGLLWLFHYILVTY